MSSHTHTHVIFICLDKKLDDFFFIDNKIEHAPKNTQTNDFFFFFFLKKKKSIFFQ